MNHFLASKTRHLRSLVLGISIVVLLGACLPDVSSIKPSNDPSRQAQRDADAGRYDRAARSFERLANTSSGAQRDAYLLDASRAWFNHGESMKGLATLRKVRGAVPENDPVIGMLRATQMLVDNKPDQALARLSRLQGDLPTVYVPAWLELRARAQSMKGDAAGVINTLTSREARLKGKEQVEQNRRLIWYSLRDLGRKGHSLQAESKADKNISGWLELAALYRDYRRNPHKLRQQIEVWQETYPAHIAVGISDDLSGPSRGDLDFPTSVALLLPVNGRLSGPGIAIRDGFLSAYMNDNDNPDRPAVRVYDTGSNDAADLYRQAIEDGVNFIVGPLSKKNVQSLVENKLTGISTLALNYLPDELLPGASLYQFSLAPEHESAEVARRALTNGFTRGVVLLPDSDWGQRMLQSFGETFEAGGGVVLDFNMYDPKEKDFSGPITDLLNLNSSKHRHRAISAVVGTSLEFEPRRRQDTEFVFLAANAKQGQLLRPQLNYHYANDLPVLSTSAIFNDDSTQNSRDLDGVIFADAPWMISDDPEIRTSRQTLNQFWPGRMKRRSRLYAMGIDAYHLIPLLFGQRQPLDTAWPGMTGMLTMEPGNRIVRTLDIAEIRNGEAVYLPASDADLDSSAVSAEDAAP